MKRLAALFCVFFIALPFFAQEIDNPDDDEDSTEEIEKTYSMNEPGDQYIRISLLATAPLNFGGTFPLYRDGSMSLGGHGSLGYHRFLTSWFAIGGDVNFGYNPTIGENIFTYVPLVGNITIQPTISRFEFPLTLGAGIAMETYLNRTYFPGFVAKGDFGIYYRVSPSWSFGLDSSFVYMPQWYSDSQYNDYGIFASAGISARYHF